MITRRGLLLGAAALARAQDVTFSTDVKVVNLFATVLDKRGALVRDLAKEDFTVTENGKPQAIKYFSRETDLPIVIGLMVDTSMSQQKVLNAERGASLRFFDQVLRDNKDRVFVMQFDMSILLRQPLTGERQKLYDTLALVDTPTRYELERASAGTLLFDSVIKASREIMQKEEGRKAFIILSDGVDVGSEAGVADAIEAAQRADTFIYSIYFTDPAFYSFGSPNGRAALTRLARETGGAFFEVTKKLSIEQVFQTLQEELRSQYSIGFVSDQPVRISEWRKIQLSMKSKGLQVQVRDRYWAKR